MNLEMVSMPKGIAPSEGVAWCSDTEAGGAGTPSGHGHFSNACVSRVSRPANSTTARKSSANSEYLRP